MKYLLKHIAYLAFILTFALSVFSANAAAEELNSEYAKSAATDKASKSKKANTKSTKKSKKTTEKSKVSTSKSKKSAEKSKASSSKSKKSTDKSKKSKKNKKGDRIDKAAEASSNSTKPIYSAEEIERYKAMDYETWKSPSGVSELGLPIEPGFVQPYPYGNLMRQYCTSNTKHKGHDLGFVGEENNGMGTVINSATKAVVTFIGKPDEDIGEFGKLDKRAGEATRTGKQFPRQILVPGYGLVYPFSLNYGRWRSGYVIVTKVLDGPLKDYTIRYMHMGGIRPDLKVGSIVEAGEHIAIMGATSVLDSYPHVHMDMSTPTGARANMAPYLGIPQAKPRCKSAPLAKESAAAQNAKPAKESSKNSKKSSSKSKSTQKPKKRARNAYISKPGNTEPAQTRVLDRIQI